MDGVKEGPLFDGIRLVIADVLEPRVNSDSTCWTKGSATLKPNVRVPSGGKPNFHDYRITLYSTIVDTSKGGFGPDATPMKFLVWNLTKNQKTDVVFYDINGDNTIGPDVRVDILESDSTTGLAPAWSLFFVAQAGAISPVAGDQFVLCTVKPLTSSDVYEFTGTVSSVQPGATPLAFSLAQNYPNPFNPTTTIQFTIPVGTYGPASPAGGRTSLRVYDILGREVATLVNEVKQPGTHKVQFDGSNLASGVYFCRIFVVPEAQRDRHGQAGEFVQTRKLLLLR
jgi:hypothetical protein